MPNRRGLHVIAYCGLSRFPRTSARTTRKPTNVTIAHHQREQPSGIQAEAPARLFRRPEHRTGGPGLGATYHANRS